MITVVARWESTQMPAELERRMWKQLKGAFQIDRIVMVPRVEGEPFDQYDSMDKALESTVGQRIFLEPTGYNTMIDMPQGDVVFVLGNTAQHNMEYAQVNETYQIFTPIPTHLYGINAASIALAYWYGQ